ITYARVDPRKRPAIFRRLRDAGLSGKPAKAPVAEQVDALDSKSSSARSAGSIPARGTNLCCFAASVGGPLPSHRAKQRRVPAVALGEGGRDQHHFKAFADNTSPYPISAPPSPQPGTST